MYSTIQLHSNSIIAYGQLMIWLLLKPSAWREYVKNIDPTLQPVLTLSCFSPSLRHPPPLERLCHLMRVTQPLVVGLGICFLMSTSRLTGLIEYDTYIEDIIYGIFVGVMLSIVGSGFGSFAISLPFGLLFGGIGGILVGTGFGIGIGLPSGFPYNDFDMWILPFAVFSISLTGSVIIALHEEPHQRTMGWKIGSYMLGISVGLIVLTTILMVGAYLLGDLLLSPALQQLFEHLKTLYQTVNMQEIFKGLTNPESLKTYPRYITIAFSGGLFLGWFLRGWRGGLFLGLGLGIMIAVVSFIYHGIFGIIPQGAIIRRLLSGTSRGILYGVIFFISFTIPYLLARRIANKWAGIVAGILGYVVVYLAIRLDLDDPLFRLVLVGSVITFMLGITHQRWLPFLLWPLEAAMNLVIYRLQERYSPETLLPWHPAFWDEHQSRRQWGLETWLVKIAEQDAELGQQVLIQLSQGRQIWAVRAMQIESDMRQLEQCQEVYDIAKVHEKLMSSSELTGPNDKRLNRFVDHSRNVEGVLKQLSSYQQNAGLKTVEARLEEFLVGINGRVEMQRFREIASRWKDILADYADKLLTVNIETPYVVGKPMDERNQRVFVQRTEVSHQLRESLLSPNCPPLLLYGQRRTGKTSLLKYINLSQLLPNDILAFVDCQGILNEYTNYASFFYNLGREMGTAIRNHYPNAQIPALTKEKLHEDPFTSFDEWLDEIEPALQGKSLLLALDEFVILEEAFQKGRMERASLLGKFRNIIQHRPWIRLLFSGTHSFEELQHWASYFIQVRTLHLGYLTEAEAYQLVTRPVENFLLNYTSEASQHVLHLTHRHPALIQMLCDEIVNLKNTQPVAERLKVQLSDVETAVPKILKLNQMLFKEIAEGQVDANALKVLQFMALQGENAVVSGLSLQPLYTSESELQTAVTQLLRRELIEEGEGGYRFQIELLRRWFTRG